MQKNMIFTFDEWDFDFDMDLSEAINSLNLHNYSIGDPSMPPKPPVPTKLKHLIHDEDVDGPFETSGKKYPDDSKFSTWNMHMPSESNYRDYLLIDDRKYLTKDLNKALESKPSIIQTDLPVKRGYKCNLESDYPFFIGRPSLMSVNEFIEWTQYTKYQFNYEYNTLVKANIYYTQKGLDAQGNALDHSYKDSAEGWQKRQIFDTHHAYIDAHNKYLKFKTEYLEKKQILRVSKPCEDMYIKYYKNANEGWQVKQISKFSKSYTDMYKYIKNPNQVGNTLYLWNYFDDELAHKEVKENLFCVKIYLIENESILKHLESGLSDRFLNGQFDDKIESLSGDWYLDRNLFSNIMDHYRDFDNEINNVIRKCYDKHKIAYDEHTKYRKWFINNRMTDSNIYEQYEVHIHDKFMVAAAKEAEAAEKAAAKEAEAEQRAVSKKSFISGRYKETIGRYFLQPSENKITDILAIRAVSTKCIIYEQHKDTIHNAFEQANKNQALSLID